ncbi:MAG: hypothetical protein IT569_03660 [Leptospiraceae bacterium]|nr:hypothetical protein [Leptospiraceae bacterium]
MTEKDKPSYFTNHERNFEDHLYTYPVISRRSEGLSIGINLSLIQECNFACEYCQVDRSTPISKNRKIDLKILHEELELLTDLAVSKKLFQHEKFENTPEKFQVLKDISFSGDGEATASPFFIESAKLAMQFISQKKSESIEIKPVVITNGTILHKDAVCDILQKMDSMGGGAWIKLDAGNEKEFRRVSDTNFSFQKIKENIAAFSKITPVVLQTILYRYNDGNLSFTAVDYVDCINELTRQNAKFKYVQLYTLARATKVRELEAVPEEELKERAKFIQEKTGVDVKIYH